MLNPKNRKMEAKKKKMIAMDSSNQAKRSSEVDRKIIYTIVYKEENLSRL